MYQLERDVYKLIWPGLPTKGYTSHLILHYAITPGGGIETTRVTVSRILDYILSLYSDPLKPFQYTMADILPGTRCFPPYDEIRDRHASECLTKCLRWHPRAVWSFDYSTSPPTIKLTPYESMTPVSFDGSNSLPASKCAKLVANPRNDLVRPSVAITYEIRGSENGVDTFDWNRDIAPAGATGLEAGCVNLSLDLRGASRSFQTVEVTTADINTADLDWWKATSRPSNTTFTRIFPRPTRLTDIDQTTRRHRSISRGNRGGQFPAG
jgi:hypothetical protein